MADNFLMFSEVIPALKPDEEAWIKRQLEAVAVVGGTEHPYELGANEFKVDGKTIAVEKAEFAGCRAYRDMPDYDQAMSYWTAGFEYRFDDDDPPPEGWGRHLWLHAGESGEVELVAHFVQKFLRELRPKQCWSLTYSLTCSKSRVGEFGGGAVFVTAREIKWQNAYDFVENCRREFQLRHKHPGLGRIAEYVRCFIVKPTADEPSDTLYKVCETANLDDQLETVREEDEYVVIDSFASLSDAQQFAHGRYRIGDIPCI